MKKLLALALVLVMLLSLCPAAFAVNEDVEGEIVIYSSMYQFVIDMMDEALNKEGGPLTGYITQDTAWVFVELRVPEKYKGVQGYLPLKVVRFDQRLMLPGNVTGG